MLVRVGFVARVSDQRGQATVEAAVALPVLFMLVLLLLQPGILLYDRIAMSSAAAEGCRLLSTLPEGDAAVCEDFIRRRLGSVPQQDLFHMHGDACSWDIELCGGQASADAVVRIANKVKPLPLIGLGATLLGMLDDAGCLAFAVEARQPVQPAWVRQSPAGADPQGWVGAWLE